MQFEVWAPLTDRVALRLDGAAYAMERDPERPGWWVVEAGARDGSHYGFQLGGVAEVRVPGDDPRDPVHPGQHAEHPDHTRLGPPVRPDPRGRRLPQGPDGLSAVVDFAALTPAEPAPSPRVPLQDAVLYELHIGTFTPEGTFDSAAARLGHLVALGVTHVELMPVCSFPGRHGWGYDGVAPWAVHEPYGGPAGLVRFVEAAHAAGLGVVLDVVHNHLGPSGNHLPAFGPYFTETHHTPWGAAVNLDAPGSDEVRAYLLGSALAWLRDYRIDGLRLDAVHALADDRALTFLEELSAAVDELAAETGRPLFLIAESDRCDPRTTNPRSAGGLGLHAQWNDDFHHALHCALTGESQAYYADFAEAPIGALAKTMTRAFFHDGTWSSFRGRHHGRAVDRGRTPAHRFLGYTQTHDQIGNRALGDRLAASLSPGLLACAATVALTGPFVPMLFMGEEWGAGTPWQYFTDHPDEELAEAVRAGRRREFAEHGWKAEEIPAPQDPATRDRSCLDWAEPGRESHARLLDWYRALITLRRTHADLRDPDLAALRIAHDEERRWLTFRRGDVRVVVNLSGEPVTVALGRNGVRVLAAWLPVEHPDADGRVHVPAESAVVLGP
ncbi:malto-oligosyltrehalose trehalohydrolase [Streptomyces sp. NBC_00335]|uniref:malto-oligosyltrehalose trehalohydrolase n=1 Tax=unclassified Streptomyces TaxID=2593676 RepID=UPI0022518C0B|nr:MULTISPECIES: malto-oligosyltrehalose trehalohydrolase [unclassified Streptomyces]MCX5403813.1 malto-oligosyltrehalose trehalohydrolase [Streptomyces sp. NBC_00086]